MNEKDLEKFMAQSKMKQADLDKELDDLMDEDEDLKQMKKEEKSAKGKKNKDFNNVDDSKNFK